MQEKHPENQTGWCNDEVFHQETITLLRNHPLSRELNVPWTRKGEIPGVGRLWGEKLRMKQNLEDENAVRRREGRQCMEVLWNTQSHVCLGHSSLKIYMSWEGYGPWQPFRSGRSAINR